MKVMENVLVRVSNIQKALNELEIKGHRNASLIVFAFGECKEIFDIINSSEKEENEKNKDCEIGGEMSAS